MSAIVIGLLLLSTAGGFGSSAGAKGAASFEPSASVSEVAIGDRFEVDILLDPQGELVDTARVVLAYPSDLIRVESVSLGSILPRPSPGNAFDNVAGTVSEGGYLVGNVVSAPGTFATVTFGAVGEGNARIAVTDGSRIISNGEEVGAGAFGETTVAVRPSEPSEAPTILLGSLSHPSQDSWYAGDAFVANWTVPGDGQVTGWLSGFDREPTTNPTDSLPASTLTKTIDALSDGVWYFHLKGTLADGTETRTEHARVQVDRTPPNPIDPTTPRIRYLEGEDALLTFGTTDETSGIDHYEVSFNGGEYESAPSPLVLKGLRVGDAFVQVKAVDRAGNATFGKTGFRVYEPGTVLSEEDMASRDKEQREIVARSSSEPPESNPVSSVVWLAVISGLIVLAGAGILFKK